MTEVAENKRKFRNLSENLRFLHDVISVNDLVDETRLPCTYTLSTYKWKKTKCKTIIYPAIFKRYEINEGGKRVKNKYVQQGIEAIFVGFPDDSSGWLFYVPSTKRTYISIVDTIFDENFISLLSIPDLPFQGALKLPLNSKISGFLFFY